MKIVFKYKKKENEYLTKVMHESNSIVPCTCLCKFQEAI